MDIMRKPMADGRKDWQEILVDGLTQSQQIQLDNLGMSLASLADVGRALFHYTTADGLHGIVKDGCIWATAASYLNDASEIEYGCSVLEEVFKNWKSKNADSGTLSAKVVSALQEYFNQPQSKLRRAMTIYVTCFCARDDLLSQWRGYGQAGGYSIGFSLFPKGLKGIGSRTLTGVKPENEAYRATLMRVQYNKDQQFAALEEVLTRGLRSLDEPELTAIASSLDGTEERTAFLGMAALILEHFLMNQIVAFKNKAFEDEHEWRVVVRRPIVGDWLDRQTRDAVHLRSGRGLVIPYVKLIPTEANLPIKSITIGPTLDKARAEPSLRLLLAKKGYTGFEVNGSDIPLVM